MTTSSPLHPSVRAHFLAFSTPLEGRRNHMYLCVRGHPTTAVGAILRPIGLALALPWLRGDGSRATQDEIRVEWERIETAKWLADKGADAARKLCALHLDEATIDRITSERLDANAAALARAFSAFAAWPAAAQLAAISMCWALGSQKLLDEFPKCCAALRAGDFAGAAAECKIRESDNLGLRQRNEKNRALFLAAAHQESVRGDPSVLLLEPPPGPSERERGAILSMVDATAQASVVEAMAEARRGR